MIKVEKKKLLFLFIATFHISFVQELHAANPVLIGEHVSVGQKVAELVGPGPQGDELYYASYIYEATGDSFDLVSVDPLTGSMKVYRGPSEEGARGMALGRDGKIYLGTCWSAKIMEFDPKTGIITDRGRPGGDYKETFISDIATGADGNIYAGTYPGAKLIRYNPGTKIVEDLGKVGEANDQYIHGVVASTNGYVFGGTGSVNAKVVAYRISTGERKVLLESNKPGFVKLFQGKDNNIHVKLQDGRMFRLNGFDSPQSVSWFPSVYKNELADGSQVNMPLGGFGDVTVTRGGTTLRSFPFVYSGKPRYIFAFTTLASGPAVYGSGILDFNLFSLQENAFANIGRLGGGEAYTMVPSADSTKVVLAAYVGLAPLMVYDPNEAFRPGTNPVLAGTGQIDSSWRPHAMVVLSSGVVVAGGQPSYGKTGGPLVKWTIESNVVETFLPIANESPFSLVAWGTKIIGGTTIKNGTGAPITATQATLFIWNSETKEVDYSTKMPGTLLHGLVEVDGKIFGFCNSKWFRFNPETRELSIQNTPSKWPVNSSTVHMPDGHVWGVSTAGIFKADPRLDPQSSQVNPVTLVVSSTTLGLPLTAGIAAKGNVLYFASRSKLFKYTIPAGNPDTTPPTVDLFAPAAGSLLTLPTVQVKSTAHDDVGVAKVWFIHNGVVVSTDTAVPYEYLWPLTVADNGAHSWTARAFDGSGNTVVSPTVFVTVNVDTLTPTVPGGLAMVGKTQALDLSWTASIDAGGSGLAGYRVDISTDGGFNSYVGGWQGRDVGLGVSTRVAGLTASTDYHARVRAVDNAGNFSEFSATVSTRTSAATALSSEWYAARGTISPSGDARAYRESTEAGSHYVYTRSVTGFSTSDLLRLSILIKPTAPSARDVRVYFYNTDATANRASAYATLSGEGRIRPAAGGAAAQVSASITKQSDGWYLCSVAGKLDTSNNTKLTFLINAVAGGIEVYGGDPAAGFDFKTPEVTVFANDAAPPIVAISAPADNSVYTSAQTVTIESAATDNVGVARVEFYDGGVLKNSTTTFPAQFSWNIAESDNGSHEWTAKAYDGSGNAAMSSVVRVTVMIDATPPAVSMATPTANAVFTTPQTVMVKANATDNVGVTKVWFLQNGVVVSTDMASPYEYAWSITGSNNGPHNWSARAFDAIGNSSTTAPVPVTVNIDVTNPSVTLSTPTAGTTFTTPQTVPVKANAIDNVGVTKVWFLQNGVVVSTDMASPYEYPWAITGSNNGPHTWSARAFDAIGNSSTTASVPVTVNIDVTKPSVTLSTPTAGTTFTTPQTVPVKANATDNVGVTKVWFFQNGVVVSTDTVSPYEYGWSITGSNNGAHNWSARAFDAIGNSSTTTSVAVTVNIDGTNPLVTLSTPTAGTTFITPQTVPVKANATDNVGVTKVWFVLNDVVVSTDTQAPYLYSWAVTAANNGAHSWRATAFDAIGNSSTTAVVPVTVNIDVTPPAVALTTPTANAVFTTPQTVEVKAEATDNVAVSKVWFIRNGVVVSTDNAFPYEYNWTISGADNGPYTWAVKAFDAVGNSSTTAGVPVTVAMDHQAPSAPVGLTAEGLVKSMTLAWAASSDEGGSGMKGYSVDLSTEPTFDSYLPGWNNKFLGLAVSTTVGNLALDTVYYARVLAQDNNGNMSSYSAPVSARTAVLNADVELTEGWLGVRGTVSKFGDTWTYFESAETGGHYAYKRTTSGLSTSDSLRFSVMVKATEAPSRDVSIMFYNTDITANRATAKFTLSGEGTVSVVSGGETTGATGSISAQGGGWYLCSVSARPDSENGSKLTFLIWGSVGGNTTYAGNTSAGFQFKNPGVTSLPEDTRPPTVAIPTPTAGTTFNAQQTVSIQAAASDNVAVDKVWFLRNSVVVSTDNAFPYEYNWTISGADNGPHTWTATAFDAIGNSSTTAPVPVTVNIDVTNPSVTLSTPTAGTTFITPQTVPVKANATDNVGVTKVWFFQNGVVVSTDTVSPYEYGWSITGSNNGAHNWSARAFDAIGNSSTTAPVPVTVNIDVTKPSVTLSTPTAGTTFTTPQTVPVKANATDNVGVTKVWFLQNGVVVSTDMASPYEYAWSITGSNNGPHNWSARAFDAIGNSSTTATVPVTVNIDVTKPSVTLSTPTAGTTFITPQTVPVKANATDNVGVTKVWFLQNGVVVSTDMASPYEYPWAITGSNNGPHTWSATAFDDIGNSSTTAPVSITVNIDVTKPSVSLSTPTVNAVFATPQTFTVKAAATDNVGVTKVWFVLNDVVVSTDTQAPYLYSWAVTAANNGAHSWRATAFDAIGNSSTTAVVPVTVNIDVTPPAVALTTPTANAVFTTPQTVEVKAEATDNVAVSKVWFIRNGVVVSTDNAFPYEYNWTISGADNGPYTWAVKAFDAVGNSSTTAGVPVTVAMDHQAPSAPAGLTAEGLVKSMTLAWAASSDEGGSGIKGYSVDLSTEPTFDSYLPGWNNKFLGLAVSTTVGNLALDTVYYARVLAQDNNGNMSSYSAPVSARTAVLNADVELTEGWLGVRGTVSKFGDTWTYFESAETGGHYAYKRTTSGLSTSDSLRFSVMVKATEAPSRDVSIMFYNTDITANRATAKFTLSGAGTVSVVSGGETTGATGSISAQGGGWYLCSVSARPDSENGSKLTFLIWGSVGGNTTYAGNTSAGFQFKNPGVTSLPEDTRPPTVAIPTPTAGTTFNAQQTVSIQAAASDNVAVDKVWFLRNSVVVSTDNAFPYEYNWTISGADNGPHTWTATAFDAIGNSSTTAPVPVTVNIDVTNPSVTLSTPTAGTTFITPQTVPVRANATDNVGVTKVWFFQNGVVVSTDTVSPYEYGWSITGSNNGAHNWSARAFDAIGNSSTTASVAVTVNIDGTNPLVTLSTPTAGTTFITPQTVPVRANATDNVGVTKVWFVLNDVVVSTDTQAPYLYSWAVTAANNGAHSWRATAFDAIGNSSTTAVVPVTVNIDVTRPSVAITTPTANAVFTTPQTVTVKANATDNVGVSKVWFILDGVMVSTDTVSPYEYGWLITGANNEAHTWSATAFDAIGNSSTTASVPVTVNIDFLPPSVPAGLQAVAITSTSLSLSWSLSTDNVGVAGYRIRRGTSTLATVESGGTSFTENGLSANTFYLYGVLAFDAAGNESAVSPDLAVTTARAPLLAPSGSVTGVTSRSIAVRWEMTANATRYHLAASQSNNTAAPFSLQQETAGTNDSLSGLTPNTTYYFFLNACDETDCTAFALAGQAVTHATVPTLKSVEVMGREARLTIDPQGNPAGTLYRIETSRGGGSYAPVANGKDVAFVVGGLTPGERYQFRVTAENHGGVKTSFSNVVAAVLAPETVNEARAYPVPFRPGLGAAAITFDQLPEGTPIRIFTAAGQEVKSLATDATGRADWDLTNDEGQSVASGVYVAVMEKNGGRKRLKVVVQK